MNNIVNVEVAGSNHQLHLTHEDLFNCCNDTKRVNWLKAAMIPVRVNKGNDFAKDFLSPTVVNHALRVNNAVVKVFATLGAIIFDVLTFPIRLLTVIPRMLTASTSSSHPLTRKLKELGYPNIKEIEKVDKLKVTCCKDYVADDIFLVSSNTLKNPIYRFEETRTVLLTEKPSSYEKERNSFQLEEKVLGAVEVTDDAFKETEDAKKLIKDFTSHHLSNFQVDHKCLSGNREFKVVIYDGKEILGETILKSEGDKELKPVTCEKAITRTAEKAMLRRDETSGKGQKDSRLSMTILAIFQDDKGKFVKEFDCGPTGMSEGTRSDLLKTAEDRPEHFDKNLSLFLTGHKPNH